MTADLLQLLTEAVNSLTRPYVHREPVNAYENGTWTRRYHFTEVSGLLEQLREAVEPGGTGDTGRAVPSSRPSARLDSIVTLIRIEAAASLWLVNHCGQPLRPTVEDNLRALVGQAPNLDERELWDLTNQARRWVTMARVSTGWEVPAFRPDNTCPLCATRGGLRIRAGDGVTSSEASALCVDCGETWDASSIGLLAEHIRSENGDEAGVA